ncbi:MAG: FHA domain-containing protein [Myxococcaceae bacterium]|nr:FHA domain-containing protein [Myxococcaceae bacterium]
MARWAVLVVTQQRVTPVELPTGRPLLVGRGKAAGLELKDPRVDERHLSLRVVNDRPLLDPLGGTSGVLVNDVPCEAPMALSAGDELALGDSRLVVMALGEPKEPGIRLASEDELSARLDEEVRRAGERRPLGFVLVSTAGLNVAARQALTRRVVEAVGRSGAVAGWGEVADDLVGGVVPELPAEQLSQLLGELPAVAGPRAKTAAARGPGDGRSGDALMEVALCRLLDLPIVPQDWTVADAVMMRLYGLAEDFGERAGPIVVLGAAGSGRRTLARALFRAKRLEPVELERDQPLEGRPPAVLVRDAEQWQPSALREVVELSRERRRLLVLTTTARDLLDASTTQILEVPPLSERPHDVLALADAFLREARAALQRPRLSLGADAKRLLVAYAWPGQVRELRVVMLRAARAAVRDEVGSDALPTRLSAAGPRSNLRGALKEAERDLLLEALARTRWNVTAAASRLGLPRRTVVYRMARLGLKRPARLK